MSCRNNGLSSYLSSAVKCITFEIFYSQIALVEFPRFTRKIFGKISILNNEDLFNNPPFKKGGRLLGRLLAAKFRPIRMQQNSNLHTRFLCEFTVFIYRGGDSLVDTIGGRGLLSRSDNKIMFLNFTKRAFQFLKRLRNFCLNAVLFFLMCKFKSNSTGQALVFMQHKSERGEQFNSGLIGSARK